MSQQQGKNYGDWWHEMKLSLFVICCFLVGCSESKPDLKQYIATIQSQNAAEIKPAPIMVDAPRFSYSATALRNPFMPAVKTLSKTEEKALAASKLKPNQYRTKEALEAFSLLELAFVGTLKQENEWALVRDPKGTIHRIQRGNYLGLNDGRLIEINEHELVLKEIVQDEYGIYIEKKSLLSALSGRKG